MWPISKSVCALTAMSAPICSAISTRGNNLKIRASKITSAEQGDVPLHPALQCPNSCHCDTGPDPVSKDSTGRWPTAGHSDKRHPGDKERPGRAALGICCGYTEISQTKHMQGLFPKEK